MVEITGPGTAVAYLALLLEMRSAPLWNSIGQVHLPLSKTLWEAVHFTSNLVNGLMTLEGALWAFYLQQYI